MKHIIIIILTLLSITINAQGIRLNSKQSVIDSTRLNATGDSLYYYQNGLVLRVEGITGAGGGTSYNNISETADTLYIAKYLDVDTSTLYVDATTNRVGIGTSTPSGLISVSVPASTSAGFEVLSFKEVGSHGKFAIINDQSGRFLPSFYGEANTTLTELGFAIIGAVQENKDLNNGVARFGAITIAGLEIDSVDGSRSALENSDILAVNNYTTNLFKIAANGNVGIGTSSPSAKLEVSGGDANFDSGTLFVDESANRVGIGTNSPEAALHLTSNLLIDNAVAIRSKDPSGNVNDMFNYFSDGNLYIGTGASNANVYFRNPGTALTIQSITGNVGIGTTSPDSKLEVNGSATNTSANNEGSDATIDFSLSNIAYTSSTSSTISLTNIKDGGAYTLISTATNVSSAVTFTVPTGFSIIGMGTVARTNGKRHIYSFIVADGNVYVTMGTEN